jgi:hypothetical protein
MGIQSRSPFVPTSPGPYVAVVVNHIDESYMGDLEVAIIKGYADNPDDVASETVVAHYLSPFYGVTSLKYNTGNSDTDFQETQKSYGMWMVPPDLGTRVLVIFVDGDYSQCYWIGCIMDKYMNNMIPGIGSKPFTPTTLDSTQQSSYADAAKDANGNFLLPAAEYNKVAQVNQAFANGLNPDKVPRPIHPFADILASQGLLGDTIRGVTSSSARRESPSRVFGISTPGPFDESEGAQQGQIKYGGLSTSTFVSRLGGSTFVMDDGDLEGKNELVRLRTRTGHQILLHNTADLIYIANASGTAWIELTSQGKVDIYSQDSVSIHSEADFNFRADRNINFEAGQNFNMSAVGSINIESRSDLNMLITGSTTVSTEKAFYLNSGQGMDIYATGSLKATGGKGIEFNGDGIKITGGTAVNINATNINHQGKTNLATSAPAAKAAEVKKPDALQIFSVPTSGGSGSLNSIMQRVPTHEPWPQHENINPDKFSAVSTDNTPASDNTQPIPGVVPANETSTGVVDATGAIQFSTGSGDAAHFAKTTAQFQEKFKAMAVEYKEMQNRPIKVASSYRSYAEQKELYDLWLEYGKGAAVAFVPGRGRIITPAKPDKNNPNAHAKGIAADIDENQAAYLYQKKLLAKYGFAWGGLFRTPDRVHIYLISANASASE